jgi:PAS domain S-box-containing protein
MGVAINGDISMNDIPCTHDAHQDELLTLRNHIAACELERDTLRQELAALRSERDYFRHIADGTYDWEYWRAPDGRYSYVSPSCERITGYASGEFQGDPGLLERIVHPDDYERFAHHLHTEHDFQQSYELEFRIVTRSGETCWIGHACQPVYGNDGEWLGQRASNRDITAQKQAEATLLQSQQFIQRITEIAPYMIYVFDLARGCNTFVNTYGLTFFGCTLDEMQQLPFRFNGAMPQMTRCFTRNIACNIILVIGTGYTALKWCFSVIPLEYQPTFWVRPLTSSSAKRPRKPYTRAAPCCKGY